MAKKIINDDKMSSFIEKNWENYQKAQKKQTAKKTVKKSTAKGKGKK